MLEIRDLQQGDMETVLTLHRDAFEPVFLHEYQQLCEISLHDTDIRFIVAGDSSGIVGFGTHKTLSSDDVKERSKILMHGRNLLKPLDDTDHVNSRKKFEKYLQGLIGNYNYRAEGIEIGSYRNPATEGDFMPQDNDIKAVSLAVTPKHQRRGIGRKLTEKLIEIARANNTSAIYADILGDETGSSFKLYESLGAMPIMKLRPLYPNGYAGIFVYLPLA
ncbi:MAG: GNAT family N-acetyltransferase [Candidatus Aenigmarchaeota archaeon]|nr:GNAT family N-acetyltransferase [Candidatus Aenigmarchaeota archaeon]